MHIGMHWLNGVANSCCECRTLVRRQFACLYIILHHSLAAIVSVLQLYITGHHSLAAIVSVLQRRHKTATIYTIKWIASLIWYLIKWNRLTSENVGLVTQIRLSLAISVEEWRCGWLGYGGELWQTGTGLNKHCCFVEKMVNKWQ